MITFPFTIASAVTTALIGSPTADADFDTRPATRASTRTPVGMFTGAATISISDVDAMHIR